MIFVCVGSRGYQFNRLLKQMDKLVADGAITEEVIAQTGLSDYKPVHYAYQKYMDVDQFKKMQKDADLIVSHAGTGALVSALKIGKQVIAVPRRKKYEEHIDDHQLQVAQALESQGYLFVVREMDELGSVIKNAKAHPICKKYEIPSNVIQIIYDFIQGEI